MAQARIEKLITIKSIFDKEGEPKFSVYDTEGNRYGGFKQWEGSNTVEYNQLHFGKNNEAFKAGDQALIQYVRSTDGKYLNLKAIYPADTTPKANQVESPQGEAPTRSQGPSGRNYDQEGYEKCAWTYFIEVCNGDLATFGTALQENVVWDAFQGIKADSNKHFSPLRQAVEKHAPPVVDEELPVIDQNEDMKVEGIPF